MPDDQPSDKATTPAAAASAGFLPSLGEWPARDAQSAALEALVGDLSAVAPTVEPTAEAAAPAQPEAAARAATLRSRLSVPVT